jgi:hypothetical protein
VVEDFALGFGVSSTRSKDALRISAKVGFLAFFSAGAELSGFPLEDSEALVDDDFDFAGMKWRKWTHGIRGMVRIHTLFAGF